MSQSGKETIAMGDFRILAVDNSDYFNRALKQVLEPAYSVHVNGLRVTENDSVADILPVLAARSVDANLIFLNAHLKFKECPSAVHVGGIQFMHHIRLTPGLARALSQLPIVLAAMKDLDHLLRESLDAVIACAPGSYFVKTTSLLADIGRVLQAAGPFASEDDMRRLISPYVLSTDDDEQRKKHDFLNRAGVGRFLKEFAGDVIPANHPLIHQFEQLLQTEIWVKKLKFLRPDVLGGTSFEQVQAERLRRQYQRLKGIKHDIVYVDDEHYRGWSFGLHAGLTGDASCVDNFANPAGNQNSTDSLLCLGQYADAQHYFENLARTLDESLDQWHQADVEAMLAEFNVTQSTIDCKKAEAGSVRQEADLKIAEKNAKEAVHRGSPAAHEDLKTLQGACDSARKRADHAKGTLQQSTETLAQAKQKKSSVEANLFSRLHCNALVLDLRISPTEDASCAIEDTTGIRLLRQVKRRFPFLPIVMMTASEKALTSETAHSFGADGYWVKGIHSGEQLQRIMQSCLAKAELRQPWLQLNMLKAKRQLWCFALNYDRNELEPRVLFHDNERARAIQRLHPIRAQIDRRQWVDSAIEDRAQIIAWVEDAILLLYLFGDGQQSAPFASKYYPFDHVLLNMGRVQELRYGGPKNQDWEYVYRQCGLAKGDKSERRLHRLRNDLAHGEKCLNSRSDAREEAKFYLHFTLEMLLRNYLPNQDSSPAWPTATRLILLHGL